MNLKKEEEKRQEFVDILLYLANISPTKATKEDRAKIYRRLENLYYNEEDGTLFRHFYSDIFIVMTQMKDNHQAGDSDRLLRNLEIIRKGYHPQNPAQNGKIIDISSSLRKLYDHVNLDRARIDYSEGLDVDYSGEDSVIGLKNQIKDINDQTTKNLNDTNNKILEYESKYQKSQKALVETQDDINKVKKEVESTQKKYITVLGIFSTLVLAFTSGIAFSTSVFQNMHLASSYRVVVVCLLIAFALINPFFILVFYLRDVWGKNAKKETEIKFVVVFNAIIIISIILTTIFWGFGLVEKRNAAVEKELESTTSIVTEAQTESTTQALETLIETTGVTVPKK